MNRPDSIATANASVPSATSSVAAPTPPSLDIDRVRAAAAHWSDTPITFERVYAFDETHQLAVAAGVDSDGETARVMLLCNMTGRLLLHWGVGARPADDWTHPPQAMQPTGSQRFDDRAIRSPFERDDTGMQHLELTLGTMRDRLPRAVNFVIYDATNDHWLKDGKRDMQVRLRPQRGAGALEPIIEQIGEAEAGERSWTLMHRFNLCCDLLDELDRDPDGMALLFAWLRYSAIRQLDWQRQYNTKPRELAHAQDRLTQRFADLFAPGTETGMWARLMLSTVGRGGEGQQVRDQILHIMHRRGIKERHGTWIEQWHQKLHNNTTPDDIVICEAYLAFLLAGGDIDAYWHTLEAGGVTRERLASFERPITREPADAPERRDGLMHDFSHFLHVLKSVHAGTDLATSIDAAHDLLGRDFANWLRHLLHERAESADQLAELVKALTEARQHLHHKLSAQRDAIARRNLLYVDLGIEMQLRTAVERCDISHAEPGLLVDMARHVLANLALVAPDEAREEYRITHRAWQSIDLHGQSDRETLLRALAATERTSRAVRDHTDRLYARLQPKAEALGKRCRVDRWTIPIFSEEVVRGTLAFVLAKLVRHLEPALRSRAGLGGWQIISPGEASGRVRVTEALRALQGARLDEPTIVIADDVTGDEDIPSNVRAVLTRATPDIVSHVAVRARNEHVLLASCLDEATYEQLQAQRETRVRVTSTASGDVRLDSDDTEDVGLREGATPRALTMLRRPELTMDVIGPEAFTPDHVGGKSNNLMALRAQLSEWVSIPPSVALTFGTCEHVFELPENEATARTYGKLCERVDDEPAEVLPKLRDTVETLVLPNDLCVRIESVCEREGLALPDSRDTLWDAIRKVWASKWTERAYWSRHRLGMKHDALVMAALIQQVVPADYAFVIHTTDPTTMDAHTLYAEVVAGLGETLVGNYPGKPLAFRANKESQIIEWVSLPSKSVALRGEGVIVRSDSNGEDLPGYAGAGLHDSVMTSPPAPHRLDDTDEPMVQDGAFRERLCRSITALGVALEKAAGSAQDIEGAVVGETFYALQTRRQVGL